MRVHSRNEERFMNFNISLNDIEKITKISTNVIAGGSILIILAFFLKEVKKRDQIMQDLDKIFYEIPRN